MDKALNDLREAVANLKVVAKGLRYPLDTSTVDKALAAVEAAAGKKPASPPPPPPPPAPKPDAH